MSNLGTLVLGEVIRKWCEEHYEEGYDTVVECWDHEEMQRVITENNICSVDDFVVYYAPIKEYREDMEAEKF